MHDAVEGSDGRGGSRCAETVKDGKDQEGGGGMGWVELKLGMTLVRWRMEEGGRRHGDERRTYFAIGLGFAFEDSASHSRIRL